MPQRYSALFFWIGLGGTADAWHRPHGARHRQQASGSLASLIRGSWRAAFAFDRTSPRSEPRPVVVSPSVGSLGIKRAKPRESQGTSEISYSSVNI